MSSHSLPNLTEPIDDGSISGVSSGFYPEPYFRLRTLGVIAEN
jgi:hypothetical protein